MSNPRVVSIDGLRQRLGEALGRDSLLFRRFDLALSRQDERLIEAAMAALSLYPPDYRAKIEDVFFAWLFEGGGGDGLAALPAAGEG